MRGVRSRALAAAVVAGAVVVSAAGASGSFAEPVRVIHTFEGTNPQANFGWAVSELGDVDGDGAMEVIVGEPFTSTGTTWVFSGRTGDELYRLDGRTGDWQGFAMADAGDVDADGVPDVVSGAPARGPGHAYVYSGADGRLLHTLEGVADGDFFGWAVSSAGDQDGDGHADVLVGAPFADEGGTDSGRAYVFSGRTGERLRKLDAGHAGEQFGSGTDLAGDLDGDGVPDLVVGARDAGPGKRGKAYAFSGRNARPLWEVAAPETGNQLGSFFVAGLGDTNGDGIDDVYAGDYADSNWSGRAVVLSGADGSELLAFAGEPGAGLSPGRQAGDVDGDGLVDLAIGSFTYGADGAGRIELRSGRDGSVLRTITSATPGENFGFDAVGLGDVDGDGRPDLLASAATGERVYVIAG